MPEEEPPFQRRVSQAGKGFGGIRRKLRWEQGAYRTTQRRVGIKS